MKKIESCRDCSHVLVEKELINGVDNLTRRWECTKANKTLRTNVNLLDFGGDIPDWCPLHSGSQAHHNKPQTIPKDTSIWYGRL